ncbi:YggS family pyridoxal phosphate-dependent enzyme [Floridanema evergladense]|uniref:Pyridoxal phosphate homeostasis protein n=1 Tax=Floridaenema evergladense BLCC-F167 TaxID=3153639 RepID=A0ABV4WWY3_9CYAN
MSSSQLSTITDRIATVRQQLPETVRLIAVSKQVPVEAMREAYSAGIRDFGESRLPEAALKQSQLQDLPDITWHLIGHLQTNKAKKALEHFQWIHSLDSLKLAQTLDRLAKSMSINPQVLLQVKLLPDPNKYGWTEEELFADLPALNECQNLQIKGLMTIAPLNLTEEETLKLFQNTGSLAAKIQQQNWSHIQMQDLSMGMSDDYHLAVQGGTTMVRLGRTLFGSRS